MNSRSESAKPGPKGPAFRLYAPTNNLATNDAAAPTRASGAPSGLRRARVASLRFQARASGLWIETLHRSAPFRIRPRTNYARQTGRHHHPTHHQLRLPAAHVADARPASTSTKPIAHGSLLHMSPPPPRPASASAPSQSITAPCCAGRRHQPGQHQRHSRPDQSRLPAAQVAATTPGQHQRQRRASRSRLPAAQVAATTPASTTTSTEPTSHGSLLRMSPPPPPASISASAEPVDHGSLLRMSPPPPRPAPPPQPTRSITAPCCAGRRHHPDQHHHHSRPDQSRLPAAHVSALIKIDPGVLSKTDPPTEFLSLDLQYISGMT